MIGNKVGSWTVLNKVPAPKKNGHIYYQCECACGSIRLVTKNTLTMGTSTQCQECFKGRKNFRNRHPSYSVWIGLFTRCYNSRNRTYKFYGAKGIKVCDRWHEFDEFVLDMGIRPENYQLDRIDPDKDYFKENCRWVSKEDNRKTQRSRHIPIDSGTVFFDWTVLERDFEKPVMHAYYKCKCKCGTILSIIASQLRAGGTKQCRDCKNVSHIGWGDRLKKRLSNNGC